MRRGAASAVLFLVLAGWTAGWLWVVRVSGWLPLVPLAVWLLLLAATVVPLEVLYRRLRPAWGGDRP